MSDDRGLRHRGSQDRPGPPQAGLPGCGQPLRPWGRARERTVRDLGGALVTVRPDRASCPGCEVTHVVLDAGLLPRRAYAAGLIGQALVAAALGSGHRRIARDLAVPAGTVAAGSAAPAGPPPSCASPASAPSWHLARTACGLDPPTSWAARWSTWRPRRWSSAAAAGWSTPAGGRGSTCSPAAGC